MKKYMRVVPEGTKDIVFKECMIKRDVEQKLSDLMQSRGYSEVITPGLEYYDVFSFDGAGIDQSEMYKTTDNSGRLLVFRPDSTLPIARLAASRLRDAVLPLRLYYNQGVYRNRPDLSGKSHEISQMGIELLGAKGLRADLEAISIASRALGCFFDEYRIEIGNAMLFRELAAKLNTSESMIDDLREAIEAKNYALLDSLLDELEPSESVEAMRMLPKLFGGFEIFDEAEKLCVEDETKKMLSYMRRLCSALEELGLGEKIMIDLGLVQRHDYYSGVIFSAYTEYSGDAVLVGGRYDNLLGNFGTEMAAVGFSIDVQEITSVLMRSGRKFSSAKQLVVFAEEGYEVSAEKVVMEHVNNGVKAELSVFESLEETLEYAKKMMLPKLVIVGKEVTERDVL